MLARHQRATRLTQRPVTLLCVMLFGIPGAKATLSVCGYAMTGPNDIYASTPSHTSFYCPTLHKRSMRDLGDTRCQRALQNGYKGSLDLSGSALSSPRIFEHRVHPPPNLLNSLVKMFSRVALSTIVTAALAYTFGECPSSVIPSIHAHQRSSQCTPSSATGRTSSTPTTPATPSVHARTSPCTSARHPPNLCLPIFI